MPAIRNPAKSGLKPAQTSAAMVAIFSRVVQLALAMCGSTRQFSAYVPISPNTIRWLVNDVVGGNTTVGTISTLSA